MPTDLNQATDRTVTERRRFLRTTAIVGAVAGISDIIPSVTSAETLEPVRESGFDFGWRFERGEVAGAQSIAFDDRTWRALDLPHDWSIENAPGAPADTAWKPPAAIWQETPRRAPKPGEFLLFAEAPKPTPGGAPRKAGPFDADASIGKWGSGWTLGGTGWYRKRFRIAPAAGERIELRFDGVYHDAEIWLNGVAVGSYDRGYAGFTIDLTPHLATGGENVLAVRVRNEGFNSRWYNGSGIYRHVWLVRTPAVRLAEGGVFVTTPHIARSNATVRIAVEVENRSAESARAKVRATVRDASGRVLGEATGAVAVAAGQTAVTILERGLNAPRLWSPADPAMHVADVEVTTGTGATDRISVPFGIRAVAVDAKLGLTINGEAVKLKGACLHHDHGIIGVASFDHAEERKVALLKANGFNAIRCSHNLYAPAFYDACDRLGMMVIDETFDVWNEGKFGHDLGSTRFKTKWRDDVAAMVRRDRNHPSIVFWSIGNEIPERNRPEGVATAAKLRDAVLALDDTRLITAALAPLVNGKAAAPSRRSLDVVGYNYMQYAYEPDHADDPDTVFMGTEQFAADIHDAWRKVERYPWLIGDFVWTGIDYIGEVGAGAQILRQKDKPVPKSPIPFSIFLWDYPFYQSGCGEIDLIGLKKPQSWYRDVLWGRSPIELLVRRPTPVGYEEMVGSWAFPDELKSWTWPGAGTVSVRTYTAGDEVRVLLDGQEVARARVRPEDKLIAELPVAYRPGTLVAVAYRDGAEIGRRQLETVGKPTRLRIRAERTSIAADRGELAYIYTEVCDGSGRVVPDAQARVEFAVLGPAQLLATGSANPRGLESFADPRTTTFHGVAQAILRPTGRRGEVVVTVRSSGLAAGRATIALG